MNSAVSNQTAVMHAKNSSAMSAAASSGVPANSSMAMHPMAGMNMPPNNAINMPHNNSINMPSNNAMNVPPNNTMNMPANAMNMTHNNAMNIAPNAMNMLPNNGMSMPPNNGMNVGSNNMNMMGNSAMNFSGNVPANGMNMSSNGMQMMPNNVMPMMPGNAMNMNPNAAMNMVNNNPMNMTPNNHMNMVPNNGMGMANNMNANMAGNNVMTMPQNSAINMVGSSGMNMLQNNMMNMIPNNAMNMHCNSSMSIGGGSANRAPYKKCMPMSQYGGLQGNTGGGPNMNCSNNGGMNMSPNAMMMCGMRPMMAGGGSGMGCSVPQSDLCGMPYAEGRVGMRASGASMPNAGQNMHHKSGMPFMDGGNVSDITPQNYQQYNQQPMMYPQQMNQYVHQKQMQQQFMCNQSQVQQPNNFMCNSMMMQVRPHLNAGKMPQQFTGTSHAPFQNNIMGASYVNTNKKMTSARSNSRNSTGDASGSIEASCGSLPSTSITAGVPISQPANEILSSNSKGSSSTEPCVEASSTSQSQPSVNQQVEAAPNQTSSTHAISSCTFTTFSSSAPSSVNSSYALCSTNNIIVESKPLLCKIKKEEKTITEVPIASGNIVTSKVKTETNIKNIESVPVSTIVQIITCKKEEKCFDSVCDCSSQISTAESSQSSCLPSQDRASKSVQRELFDTNIALTQATDQLCAPTSVPLNDNDSTQLSDDKSNANYNYSGDVDSVKAGYDGGSVDSGVESSIRSCSSDSLQHTGATVTPTASPSLSKAAPSSSQVNVTVTCAQQPQPSSGQTSIMTLSPSARTTPSLSSSGQSRTFPPIAVVPFGWRRLVSANRVLYVRLVNWLLLNKS